MPQNQVLLRKWGLYPIVLPSEALSILGQRPIPLSQLPSHVRLSASLSASCAARRHIAALSGKPEPAPPLYGHITSEAGAP